jgi:hypothetical protein
MRSLVIVEATENDAAGVRLGGPFEIRPAAEEVHEIIADRDRAAQSESPR